MTAEEARRIRWFTADDLAGGELCGALYVVLFQRVFDLKDRVERAPCAGAAQLLRGFTGQDISHLFNSRTGCPVGMHPLLALEAKPLTEQELGLCAPGEAVWWVDAALEVGRVTGREVLVRIVNTLTFDEQSLCVACEETLDDIAERYLPFNAHARSYTWKDVDSRKLAMHGTLASNGLLEPPAEAAGLLLPAEDRLQPLLLLHFNDDLSEL